MNSTIAPRAEPALLAAGPDAASQLRVRRAAVGDREALTRMFGRYTGRTRYERFHGYVNAIPDKYLTEALSGTPIHYALVALTARAGGDSAGGDSAGGDSAGGDSAGGDSAGGDRAGTDSADAGWGGHHGAGPAAGGDDGDVIVALASCRAIAEGVAELGLLVEDRWQRNGVGGRLLRELVGYADHIGMRVLKAQILGQQAWIINVLRSYGACHVARAAYGTLDVTLRLGPEHITRKRAEILHPGP
jgi:GNAT superfamily N-acetyltransferase